MTELARYQMLIDGKWLDAEDGQRFESFNPATGEAWATIPEATANDVDRAVRAAHRAFADLVPYAVAMVALDEQEDVRIITNIVGCEPEDVHIGMPVEVVFEDITDELTLPQFKPIPKISGHI